jgi:predicted  nucleic acid-binding Zn-ribbon protein
MPQLFALHLVDEQLLQLDRSFRRLDNGDQARAALQAAQTDLARAEDTLKQTRVAVAAAESALKANETKQAQLNKRLFGGSVVNSREAEAVEHEIATLKSAAGDIETQILEAMDTIEATEKSANAYRDSVASREAELASVLAAYERDSAALRSKASAAHAAREGAAAPISAAIMARYLSARKRTKDTGIATVDGNNCEGCRMQIPSIDVMHLRNGTDLVNCDNCGRILFWKT